MNFFLKRILLLIGCLGLFAQLNAQSKCTDSAYRGKEWTGQWKTSFGTLILTQRGTKVTGSYRDVGKIDATYYASTGKLKGSFTNTSKKGSFEFTFSSCQKFQGRWGWGNSLNQNNWSGTRVEANTSSVATRSLSTSNRTGVYKLKITLQQLFHHNPAVGRERKFLLRFNPSLRIAGKSYTLKSKKYTRIGKEIERYGSPNQLYVSRKRNEKDFDKVLLKGKGKGKIQINNSGVFEIPKNIQIADTNTDFQISVALMDVTSGTKNLIRKTVKLNLKAMLDYLTGKKSASSFSQAKNRWKGFKDMGIGYQGMKLTGQSGKRHIEDEIEEHHTGGVVRNMYDRRLDYSIELVD